jgi:hypothetical protein
MPPRTKPSTRRAVNDVCEPSYNLSPCEYFLRRERTGNRLRVHICSQSERELHSVQSLNLTHSSTQKNGRRITGPQVRTPTQTGGVPQSRPLTTSCRTPACRPHRPEQQTLSMSSVASIFKVRRQGLHKSCTHRTMFEARSCIDRSLQFSLLKIFKLANDRCVKSEKAKSILLSPICGSGFEYFWATR